jgi:hypothetical protein
VDANQLAYPSRSRCASIRRCFNCAYVSAHKDRHITGADILFSQELNIRRFDHCISRFDSSNEAFGLHHSECF